MELLLSTLNTALADAVPVKVNELFLTAFYSPSAMAEVETFQLQGIWRAPLMRRPKKINAKLSSSTRA